MTALPSSISFTDSGVTEAQFKTAITNQREFLAGLLGTSGDVPDALTALGTLGSSTITKSSAYTVVAADRGALIECTGTFTLSLTAAATLAEGFVFAVFNKGTGIITIDPASTEQINGASTLAIAAGSWGIISCTGTAFNSLGSVRATGALIGYQIFTSSGTYSKSTKNPSFVIVEVVGGGGGGGNGSTTSKSAYGGAGGGGGGYSRKRILSASLASSETVTVGGSGGTSSFGTHCSATAGSAGSNASSTFASVGGTGGIGSGGDVNLRGSGGAGGAFILSGAGGSSFFAGGAPCSNGAGNAGSANTGGGGSGGVGTGNAGGSGGSGIVIVWEYQ